MIPMNATGRIVMKASQRMLKVLSVFGPPNALKEDLFVLLMLSMVGSHLRDPFVGLRAGNGLAFRNRRTRALR